MLRTKALCGSGRRGRRGRQRSGRRILYSAFCTMDQVLRADVRRSRWRRTPDGALAPDTSVLLVLAILFCISAACARAPSRGECAALAASWPLGDVRRRGSDQRPRTVDGGPSVLGDQSCIPLRQS